ncbi:MAG: sulfotransferase [Alphaproteobacteria bacterium]|nr:sulfotransferase [Alphaproteobacteria bacterium]
MASPPPRPHPLARSGFARNADRMIARMWQHGLTVRPPLDPEFLWRKGSEGFEAADEISIRAPEDVADFRDRLERLCASLNDEAALNALGHTMAYGQLTAAVRKRHALGRLWREQLDLAATPIAPPIVVVGQMRAGTTRLHRLLSADPAHAGTRFCNALDPVPASPDWRPVKSGFTLALARRINPWLDTLHPFGATRVDEEISWLSYALDACAYEAQWRIPSFVAFNETVDPAPIYREFARILRSDAAAMDNAELPRVLKCPQYSEALPALLEQFPDARIVLAQRDHEAVLESSVSMVASQSAFQSDHVDLAAIRVEWRRKIALRETRTEAALANFDGPVARVGFEELNKDSEATLHRVYEDLGIALSPAARAAMAHERARASRDGHRGHRAQIAGFGAKAGRARAEAAAVRQT